MTSHMLPLKQKKDGAPSKKQYSRKILSRLIRINSSKVLMKGSSYRAH